MAKKKPEKPETKSAFLRRVLDKYPDLDVTQINKHWAAAGREGEISSPLFYKVRAELGIKTVWGWGPAEPAPSRKPAPVRGTGEIFQFKITLLDTSPPIWRRVRLADCTLDRLHEQIQGAMGWTNSHLHHFRLGETLYGDPSLMQENFEDLGYEDSTATLLSEILPAGDTPFRFEYEYDFGDGWSHEVSFEGRPEPVPEEKYPVCLEGARSCPPEDIGGVWGYADFLKSIANPDDDRRRELLDWVGGKFDPEKFSPEEATKRMKKGLPDWRSMR